jgi:hypothetical protein
VVGVMAYNKVKGYIQWMVVNKLEVYGKVEIG